MSGMETDHLLSRYLQSGQSADFEEIAKAHGAMVFGTALRSTRDRTLAEEVTQEVFIILARKADAIREPHKLAAWLHRTTIQCAANTNRREAKRRKIMDHYADEATHVAFSSDEDNAVWQRAVPLLDQAIDELPATDRDAVIMRFFEDCSFKHIASKIDKSEGACRKQVYRALEKLAGLLKKRGVVVPPSVLGIGLAGCLTHDALPMATSKLTHVAIAGKSSTEASALTQSLLLMSAYKLTFLTASLAALVPIGLQWQANQARAHAIHPIEANAVPPLGERLPSQSRVTQVSTRTSAEILAEMQVLSEIRNRLRRDIKFQELMFGLKPEELLAAHDALLTLGATRHDNGAHAAAEALFTQWAIINLEEASPHALAFDRPHLERSVFNGLVKGWLREDRASLEVFIESRPVGEERELLESARWAQLTITELLAAADKALAISDPDKQTESLNRVRNYWHKDSTATLEWLEKLPPSATKDAWTNQLIARLASLQPAQAFEKTITSLEGEPQKSTLSHVMGYWADADPQTAFAALMALPDSVRHPGLMEAHGLGVSDFNVIDSMLDQLPEGLERGAFLKGLAGSLTDDRHEMRHLNIDNIAKLRPLIEALPQGEDRFSAEWNLAVAWTAFDFEGARNWYQQSGVRDSMKDKFVRYYAP